MVKRQQVKRGKSRYQDLQFLGTSIRGSFQLTGFRPYRLQLKQIPAVVPCYE